MASGRFPVNPPANQTHTDTVNVSEDSDGQVSSSENRLYRSRSQSVTSTKSNKSHRSHRPKRSRSRSVYHSMRSRS